MIRIKRPRNAPATLTSTHAEAVKGEIRTKARKGNGKVASRDFPSLWGNDDVRAALWDMQHEKCAYCERLRDKTHESDIEHFRPKADVTDESGHGYWWLAYEWTNLLFSCRICNQVHKKNFFPLAEGGVRASGENDDLAREKAYLIDPCKDDPEQHFSYIWTKDQFVWICAVPGDERGLRTQTILGLNREELLDERRRILETLKMLASTMHFLEFLSLTGGPPTMGKKNEIAAQILEETKPDKEFAGFRRDFFRANGLAKYIYQD